MKTIKVRIANNYGKKTIYPVSDNAFIFAAIAGTKTLTKETIAYIRSLGYTVETEQETV